MAIVKEGGVPRRLRADGLLLNAIPQFDATVATQGSEQSNPYRWLDGVRFQPRPCRGIQILSLLPCVDQTFDITGTDCQAYVLQMPFELLDTLNGSPLQLTMEDLDLLLNERADMMKSWAFAKALIGPVITAGTLTLAATAHAPVGQPFNSAAIPVNRAIAVLENELARTLFGAAGMIHMSPGLLHLAQSAGGLDEVENDDGTEAGYYETANGTRVVSDAGYVDAQKPQTGAVSDQTVGTDDWIYASGPVEYQYYDAGFIGNDTTESTDIAHNKLRRYRSATGMLIFDPCPVTAVLASYA